METRNRSEGQPNRKRSRDELVSYSTPARSGTRPLGAKRRTSQENLWRDLLPAAIAVGIGLASLLPLIFLPSFYGLTLLLSLALIVFGFVKGCLRASREKCYVAFDYLDFLGPLRWFIAVGFFGLYLCGYCALWMVAQIRCAIDKPKAFLPWLGVQVFGFALIFLGMIVAAISNQIWLKLRPPTQPAPAMVFNSGNPPAQAQKKPEQEVNPQNPEQKAEPPALTGDREMDQLLADLGGKNGGARDAAAKRLAARKPNQHRSIVAAKLAEVVPTSELWLRTPLIRALGVWGTAKEVPVLLDLLDDKDINTRNETLDALAKTRDERAVEPMIRCLAIFETTWHAEQALKAMGSVVEKNVLELLNQPNGKLRVPALRILEKIGTEQSIPTLEEASQDGSPNRGLARGVLNAVRKRVKR